MVRLAIDPIAKTAFSTLLEHGKAADYAMRLNGTGSSSPLAFQDGTPI